MMKVAFLMQCHKNPEQINLLFPYLKEKHRMTLNTGLAHSGGA